MLRITGVSKTYSGGVQALKNVSLTIPPGMFGLLGPNGAGKSTLMRAVATLAEPDEGEIFFGDIDVRKNKDAVRRILGYLPQEFGVYPRISARDWLDHLAVLKGFTRPAARREIVDHLLRITNLWDLRTRRLGTFSNGMRQRFGIAQALIGDPRLVIVDEPTAGLDPEERARFLDLLTEIASDVVVVLSTHIVDDVSDVCQGMAILVNGTLQCEGDPRTLLESLPGTIWSKSVTREELEGCRQNHAVLGTRWQSGRLVVHILNRDRPAEGFEPVSQDLRDLYFHTISNATKSA